MPDAVYCKCGGLMELRKQLIAGGRYRAVVQCQECLEYTAGGIGVKNGYTKLASACSFIADHIQVVIDIIKGILALGIQLTAKKPVSSVIGSAPTVAK